MRSIRYSKLASQGYINSELFSNEEIDTLFALRSKMIRVKNNFYNGNSNTLCSYGCIQVESSEHLMECKYLTDKMNDSSVLAEASYSDIYGSIEEQKQIAVIYTGLNKIRENLETQ